MRSWCEGVRPWSLWVISLCCTPTFPNKQVPCSKLLQMLLYDAIRSCLGMLQESPDPQKVAWDITGARKLIPRAFTELYALVASLALNTSSMNTHAVHLRWCHWRWHNRHTQRHAAVWHGMAIGAQGWDRMIFLYSLILLSFIIFNIWKYHSVRAGRGSHAHNKVCMCIRYMSMILDQWTFFLVKGR